MKVKIILVAIFCIAAFFRLYGVNWDQGQHLHPDERFLTMVANGISWPKDFGEYLDTAISPLNPHNRGFGFFVYGTFPIFFTKWVAESLGQGDYGNLTLIGRQLSALFDLGTVLLVFLIAKELVEVKNKKQLAAIPLLSMFFYAIMILPIQLSHFYAVDTHLVFFITLSFYLLIKIVSFPKTLNTQYLILNTFLGISFGLALASKISAALFLPVIGLGLLFNLLKRRNFFKFFVHCSLFIFAFYFTFRLAQPYVFADSDIFSLNINSKFIQNMKELKGMDDPKSTFPPAIQWRNRPAFIFPLNSLLLHGLGLPLGIISLLAYIAYITNLPMSLSTTIRKIGFAKFIPQISITNLVLIFSLLFISIVFIYQGNLYTKNMRYFVSIYPFLAILSGVFISELFIRIGKITKKNLVFIIVFLGIILSTMIWPISFLSIYHRPHSRVSASYWIYENIQPGKTLSYELWDDPLPLHLPGLTPDRYQYVPLPMYDPDVEIKWNKVVTNVEKTDYIIMSSNRLWGSIPRVPIVYPLSSEFYKALFDGSLGFVKVADITSIPCFPSAQLCLVKINDTQAEESFTVYDHPQILIFKKSKLNNNLLNSWLERSKKISS